jgi:tetratricopeptide (TPR) repeat protein
MFEERPPEEPTVETPAESVTPEISEEVADRYSAIFKWIIAGLIVAIFVVGLLITWSVFIKPKAPRSALERDLFVAEAKVKANPKDAQAHAELGAALFQLGRKEEALEAYKKALSLNPQGSGFHFGLGFIYRSQGKLDLAIKELKAENAIVPNHDAYYYLGEIYKQRKEYDLAIEAYLNAIKTASYNADAHFGLATVYEMKGEKELAKKAYQETLRYVPDHQGALTGLRRLGG